MILNDDQFSDSHAHQVGKALTDNPHLLHSPQLSSDVATSPVPHQVAPLISHAANITALSDAAKKKAVQEPNPTHWWDHALHLAGSAFSAVSTATGEVISKDLNLLTKPLKEAQRDYKFVHSVTARHGILQGTLVALGVIGGGVGGFFVGGPEGAILGSEATASSLRKLGSVVNAQDSHADSENEDYKVSMGRDVANLVGAHGHTDKGQGWGSNLSGVIDGVFDVTADPLIIAGKIPKIIREGKYLAYGAKGVEDVPIFFRSKGVQDFLASNTLHLTDDANLQKLFELSKNQTSNAFFAGAPGRLDRAYQELAKIDNVGNLIRKWPSLRGLAPEIVAAKTVDAVHDVFMRTFKEADLMKRFAIAGAPIIPSRTVLRSALSSIADKIRQPGWGDLADSAFNYNNAANFIIPKITRARVPIINPTTGKVVVDSATGAEKFMVEKRFIMPAVLDPFNTGKWAQAFAGKVRTFSGLQAATVTKDLSKISTKEFEPSNPDHLKDVLRVAYYSLGDKLSQRMTSNYINSGSFDDVGNFVPGPNTHNLWLSMQSEVLNALGFPNDPEMISQTLDKFAAVTKGTAGGQTFGYGKTSGPFASAVTTEEGTQNLALHSHQVAKWTYPDFREFKNAARSMTLYGRIYGKLDGMGNTFLSTFWNKLALTTGGFAQRVATAELIPSLIRFGAAKMVKGNIAKAAAAMNYKLIDGEEEQILAHAFLANSGKAVDYTDPISIAEFIKREAANASGKDARKVFYDETTDHMDEKTLEHAAKLAILTRGHMATGATLAGHFGDVGYAEKAAQHLDMTEQMLRSDIETAAPSKGLNKPSGRFKLYSAVDHQHDYFWMTNLQKASQNVSQKSMTKDILDLVNTRLKGKTVLTEQDIESIKHTATLQEYARIQGHAYDSTKGNGLGPKLSEALDTYAGDRKMGINRYTLENRIEFAHSRVDDMLNTLLGHDNTFHSELAQKIIAGEKVTLKEVRNVGMNSKPANVVGPELIPVHENYFERVTNNAFSKVIDPIINHMSREPLFFQHFSKAMDFYDPMVAKNAITAETGARLALVRATHTMIPQIHNVALKSQFSILSRVAFPFYFAQEQAMKRFAALERGDIQALRVYMLIHHALSNSGFVNTDSYGNKYVTMPGIGELGGAMIAAANHIPGFKTLPGLPINATGNIDSTKSILPEMNIPGVSPFVSIPLNWAAAHFPKMSNPIKSFVGPHAFEQGVMDSLLPSAPLKNLWKGLTENEKDSTTSNSMMAAIALASINGRFPPPDASEEVQQDFLDRIKHNSLSLTIIKSIAGLWSPLSIGLKQEDTGGLRQEFMDLLKTMDYGHAWAKFSKDHGSQAVSYTISKNLPSVPGATIPYTEEAMSWLDKNKHLVTGGNSTGAVFLIPQLTGTKADSQVMATELLRLGLRTKQTPKSFMHAITVASGNNEYYAASDANDKRLLELNKANNYAGFQAQDQHFKDWKTNFIHTHPIWAKDYAPGGVVRASVAQVAYLDLKDLFDKNLAPKGPQTEITKTLMTSYQNYLLSKQNPGFSNTKDLKDSFSIYLNQMIVDHPETKAVITSVFKRLI